MALDSSITKNNQALININKAISHFEEAKTIIRATNYNERVGKIIKLINLNNQYLVDAKTYINDMTSELSRIRMIKPNKSESKNSKQDVINHEN